MVENLKKMQELKAQIQAQIKLAETLKKISDNAGQNEKQLCNDRLAGGFSWRSAIFQFTITLEINLTISRNQQPGPWSQHC